MSQLISANNLSHSFAARTLFSKISLGIFEKDRIGLVGPNGAGKSTLMKILSRAITPDQGQVTWRRGLQVGYLAQTPHFKSNETIYDAIISKTLDPIEATASAYEWISKFHLDQFDIMGPVAQLSGGWKKRVALARELILSPEVLLLDEPTNHLDVEGILWLEDFLENAGGSSGQPGMAVMTITHDRLFLQRVATKIFDLDPKNPTNLLVVEGSYTQYLEEKELLIQGQKHREWTLKNTLRRETEWLRRGAKARLTKQKARIDRAYDLKDEVQELTTKNRQRKVTIDFGETDRAPKKLIEAKDVGKTFDHLLESGQVLFKNFNTIVSPKTRMGLLGPNGAGKSTLIKILLGREPITSGSVQLADEVKIAYFEQNRETLDPKKSLLKNICPEGDYVNYLGKYVFARSYLERFLFSSQQMDLPVERLSGGEQSRLRIAQMMLEPANVLVLDEPTNDLDVETLTVLEESLKEFPGAVILVTHDRYFMDQVATEILAFAKGADGDGYIERFADYFQWEAWKTEQEMKEQNPVISKPTSPTPAASSPKARKLSNKEKSELASMEQKILSLESSISSLQVEAGQPAVVGNATRLQEIYGQLAEQQKSLETLYTRWAELEKLSQ